MSYSLRHDQDDNCIVLTFDGTVDVDIIKEAAPEVARMSEETGCHLLLNDMSKATIDMSMMDVFSSPRVMDESNISRTMKRALIVPPDFSDAHFLETVTRNRGHDLMVFQDIEKAREWLLAE